MWFFILIIIVIFFFTKKKGISVVEWIRSLDIVVRVGIFTGIMGVILSLISKPFVTDSYGMETGSFSLFNIVDFVASGLIVISFLCFLYIFVMFLIGLLFG